IRPNSALYLVSVRQFRSLRPTSFSHSLTIAALSFANSSYCQACSGLSPPSFHSCRAHIEKATIDLIAAFLSFKKKIHRHSSCL
ncbi:hypothetical protein SSU93_20590, partial [Enterococcus avium]|uniref:hypothetical protein n=1 Tax=Enterococcus avium TaxID=33945 RepID=UPI002A919F35